MRMATRGWLLELVMGTRGSLHYYFYVDVCLETAVIKSELRYRGPVDVPFHWGPLPRPVLFPLPPPPCPTFEP